MSSRAMPSALPPVAFASAAEAATGCTGAAFSGSAFWAADFCGAAFLAAGFLGLLRTSEAAMSFLGRTRVLSVNRSGAPAGSVLLGPCRNNRGLRLRGLHEQPRGHDGPLRGPFVILDVGDNKHSQALRELAGRVTDADEVLRAIRRLHPGCVSVVNVGILALEQG
jgi:hypothetical protein